MSADYTITGYQPKHLASMTTTQFDDLFVSSTSDSSTNNNDGHTIVATVGGYAASSSFNPSFGTDSQDDVEMEIKELELHRELLKLQQRRMVLSRRKREARESNSAKSSPRGSNQSQTSIALNPTNKEGSTPEKTWW